MHESLTEAVIEFQETGRNWESLLARVAAEVYAYPRHRGGMDEDDCSEFFCYFYPELRGLVDRFVYQGRPFEVYLRVTMRWRLRTFASRRAHERLRKRVLEEEVFWASESEPGYTRGDSTVPPPSRPGGAVQVPPSFIDPTARQVLHIGGDDRIADQVLRKRFLFLAMKGAARITGRMIGHVAYLTGEDPDWLEARFEELKGRLARRRRRIERLRERRNLHFFRICCIQEQINLVADSSARSSLLEAMIRERSFLSNTLDEISHVPTSPTHGDIAEVLGVPKGSVDSGLFYLRNSLRVL